MRNLIFFAGSQNVVLKSVHRVCKEFIKSLYAAATTKNRGLYLRQLHPLQEDFKVQEYSINWKI